MNDTIFDKIIRNEIPSFKVWEDDKHLAFLTPFPNTPGFTVVIPKTNPGDYIFDLNDDIYSDLMLACKKVAKLLEKALGAKRVALVFEGTAVPYVHAKLIPLHGDIGNAMSSSKVHTEFHETYMGYLTTAEGPKMDDTELKAIQDKIVEAAKQ